ncbi:MAG: B12-binding domain-containing radical SAM protein [Candidatus Hodarchaeota archaeon]
MKILFVVPPGSDITKYKTSSFLNFTAPPLGLAYIAAVLEENGYSQVRILDCKALGMDFETYRRYLKQWSPNFVGIQVLTPALYESLTTARIAKEAGVPIVALGGYHPTCMPDECFGTGSNNINLIFRGEAEYTTLEYLNSIENNKDWKNVQGISFRDEKDPTRIIHNPAAPFINDVEQLPLPARHLLPLDKYRLFGSSFPATTMITSRGCPFKCDFCSVSAFYDAKWRPRSPESIANEVEVIRNELNLKAVAFVDDLFFVSNRRVREICKNLAKIDDIYWGATTRADKGDLQHLTMMRRAGCRLVFVGVESGEQSILDNIHKRTTTAQIEQYIKNVKKARMDSLASVSFGFPGETKESVIRTTNWVIEALDPSLVIFTVATPYPGTPFYHKALTEGTIKEHDYSKYNLFNPIMETSGLSREELKELIKWAYRKFYLRPSKLIQNTKREFHYALESYGLRHFLRNGLVVIKGIVNMKALTAI